MVIPLQGDPVTVKSLELCPDPSAGIGTLCGVARRKVCTRKALCGLKKEDSRGGTAMGKIGSM